VLLLLLLVLLLLLLLLGVALMRALRWRGKQLPSTIMMTKDRRSMRAVNCILRLPILYTQVLTAPPTHAQHHRQGREDDAIVQEVLGLGLLGSQLVVVVNRQTKEDEAISGNEAAAALALF
jgi:hypothetical protein